MLPSLKNSRPLPYSSPSLKPFLGWKNEPHLFPPFPACPSSDHSMCVGVWASAWFSLYRLSVWPQTLLSPWSLYSGWVRPRHKIYKTGDTTRKKCGGDLEGERGTRGEEGMAWKSRVLWSQERRWREWCPFATWILESLLSKPPADTTFVLLDGLFGQCQVGVGQARPLLQVTSPVLQRLQSVLRQLMSQGEV